MFKNITTEMKFISSGMTNVGTEHLGAIAGGSKLVKQAFCTSRICGSTGDRKILKHNVTKDSNTCPDCYSYLFWKTIRVRV